MISMPRWLILAIFHDFKHILLRLKPGVVFEVLTKAVVIAELWPTYFERLGLLLLVVVLRQTGLTLAPLPWLLWILIEIVLLLQVLMLQGKWYDPLDKALQLF